MADGLLDASVGANRPHNPERELPHGELDGHEAEAEHHAREGAIEVQMSPIPSTHTSGTSQRLDASLCFRGVEGARALLLGQLVPRTTLWWPQMAWSIEPPQFRQMTFAVSDMRAIVE